MILDLLSPFLMRVNSSYTKIAQMISLNNYASEIEELETQLNDKVNWEKPDMLKNISQRLNIIRKEHDFFFEIKNRVESVNDLFNLLKDDDDEVLYKELQEELLDVLDVLEKRELMLLLSEKFDKNSCYLSINSGAGGTESNDWVAMLNRMFLFWANNHEFQVSVVDELPGEEVGIKSITLFIQGTYAYGYLKGEQGVHRLVRISPFDANKKRHTSFASVSVFPEITEDLEVEVNSKDLRIDTYRASGAGGQHVNKTDSAVRIVHIPTGITVACQDERSQHKNREKAHKILKARLYQYYEEKKKEDLKHLQGDKKDISWGSQIRSYVFQPYQLIKDNRTGYEVGNVEKVMNGDLDPFIFEYLKWMFGKKSA